jgi:cytosine/adenosine deaminase-related metal-dependent hydrolase
MRRLLKNAVLLHLAPLQVTRADIAVAGGRIEAIAADIDSDGFDEVSDLHGKWVMPGLVCAHTHLYSALACGMPGPTAPITSFANMLEQVWWRLDKALDDQGVEASALVGGVAALRAGVTTLVDHHASPNAIDGSLERIDGALDTVGLRRILCYEVTDRDGPERAKAGVDAHRQLLARGATPKSAVMIGAHANFTVGDQTMTACADLAREGNVGLHIHVAEARDDRQAVGEGLIERMDRLGALLPGSLLAHCVHLDDDELRRVADAGTWISHQPRSNMNNAVGYAPVASFGERTMLGTDGIGADMFAELQTAWFKAQEMGVSWSPDRWVAALTAGYDFCGAQLGVQLGRLSPGAAADLIVLSPCPGPPLHGANLAAAMIFRLSAGQVRHAMIDGEWKLWAGEPLGIDTGDLDRTASAAAESLWGRM